MTQQDYRWSGIRWWGQPLRAGAAFLLLVATVVAAPQPAVTLPQIVTEVLQTHPLIRAAQARIAVAQGVEAQAGSLPSPELGYTRSKVTNEGEVGELIEFPGKRKLRAEAAQLGVRQARAQLQQVRTALAFEARRAFFARLLADQQVAAARQTLAAIDRVVAAAQKRYQAGEVAHLQVIQAKVEQARAQQDLRAAIGRQSVATLGLDVLLGRPVDAPLQVEGDLAAVPTLPDFAGLLQQALRQQPAVIVAQEETERQNKLLQLARRQKFPDLHLGFTYGTEEQVQTPGVQASVSIPLPGRYHGEVQAALGAKLAALAEAESARYQVTSQLASAWQQWLTAQAQVKTYRSGLLDESATALQAAQESYREGESGLLSVLDAERTNLLVRQQYEQALYDLQVAAAQVRYAAGEEQ